MYEKHYLYALVAALGIVTLGPAMSQVSANSYPTRPIHLLVPYPPGGGNDQFARLVGKKLSDQVGQPVVVENRSGASGLIAGDAVAKAPPDGYTILIDQSSIATNQLLFKRPPFKLREIAPVFLGATMDNVVLVNAQSAIRTIPDLIATAKAHPGKLTYGSTGIGSPQHLAVELLKSQAGIDMLHVPYRGTGAAIMALSVDEIQVFVISTATAQGYITSGKLRAIATTGKQRSAAMPDVPTVIEAGLPNYSNYNWVGIFTTAGTPPQVINKLNAELVKALNDPSVRDTLQKQGLQLVGGSPDALRAVMEEELSRYDKTVKERGIQVEQP